MAKIYKSKALAQEAARFEIEKQINDNWNKNGTTPAPSGLTITRSGMTFTLEWKRENGTPKFTSVQVSHSDRPNWYAPSGCDKNATKFSFTLNAGNYYPHTSKILVWVAMAVQWQKNPETRKYSVTKKYYEKKNGKKTEKSVTVKASDTLQFLVSDWRMATFYIEIPTAPSVSASVSDKQYNVTTFSWSAGEATAKHILTNVEWQTAWVRDYNSSNGAQVGYGAGGITGASGSTTKTESTAQLSDGHSHVRWVRARARGPRGASGWTYARHVYALPNPATNVLASVTKSGNGYNAYVTFNASRTEARPIDHIVCEYALTVPVAGLNCPSGQSWSLGAPMAFSGGSGGARFSIDDLLGEDECLFVRVNTQYNAIYNSSYGNAYGTPIMAMAGRLKTPSGLSVTTDSQTFRATITATNNSGVEDSVLAIIYQPSESPNDAFVCGFIPYGMSSVTVQCPNWTHETSVKFGVYAVAGNRIAKARSDGATSYTFTAFSGKQLMTSPQNWEGGEIPFAPRDVVTDFTDKVGTIRVSWSWSWAAASGAELSWSDHDDAWESTDEPSSYQVSIRRSPIWNISGLDVGKRWYIRVRFYKETTDTVVYSPWSDLTQEAIINLTSAPAIPALTLSESYILITGSVTASWVYVSTDTTPQAGAEICDVVDIANIDKEYVLTPDTTAKAKDYYVRSGSGTAQSPYVYKIINLNIYVLTEDDYPVQGKVYYSRSGAGTNASPYVYTAVETPTSLTGLYELSSTASSINPSASGYYEVNCRIIARTTTQQQVTISAQRADWKQGETHYLAVRVLSASGCLSNDWSAPVPVTVVNPITCEITETSLDEGVLTDMPLTLTVEGAGNQGTTQVVIERSEPYQILRPDGTYHNGYEGECVFIHTQTGEAEITVNELIGRFDDGAGYRITAYTKDSYGQEASDIMYFRVGWEHQAIMPLATAYSDTNKNVVYLTIGEPTGVRQGDTCDIYRLSVDVPELILEGAEFGEKYVDPYPAIGDFGGHRIVYRSVCGDYITENNLFAWIDLKGGDDDAILLSGTVINFGNEEVHLERNVDLSSSWDKDFKSTVYLGGSVQGDWNPAVVRTGSIGTAVITVFDQEAIQKMRRLAEWADICHVRTEDGSSYDADVQVSESMSHDDGGMIATYSLKISKVDPQVVQVVKYSDWITSIAEDYDETRVYFEDDYVNVENVIYRCIEVSIGPEEWTSSHWEAVE